MGMIHCHYNSHCDGCLTDGIQILSQVKELNMNEEELNALAEDEQAEISPRPRTGTLTGRVIHLRIVF